MDGGQAVRQRTLYRYRFGTAELDEAGAELRIGGVTIELQKKPLEILAFLLRHSDEIVTKEELLEAVWPGMTTVENVIANAMTKLRTALGDGNAARIVTLSRIGYRFQGPVERVAAGRSLASALDLKPGMPMPGRDNFVLTKLIGGSPGSEVWTARQGRSREVRVYKISAGGAQLAGLKREATLSRVLRAGLGARVDIVRILDWNFQTPPFFLECEYGGQSLTEWAEADGRLAEMALPERLGIVLQIVDAVSAAHGVGVLHKDLKPGNVLVAPEGSGWQVRLTDFGSGRLLEAAAFERMGITADGLTVNDVIDDSSSGTPLYLAPELIAGEVATQRSDIYALGLILYQMIVGDLRRPLLSSWERDIPDDVLRDDVAAATDGDPCLRLDSAAELGRRLRALDDRRCERQARLEAEAAARIAADAIKRDRIRRPWVMATVAGLGLGLVVSLTLYWQTRQTAQELADEVHISRTLTRFLTDDLIAAADPSITGRADVTVAEATRTAATKLDVAFRSEAPEIRAALHGEMQKVFMGLTEYGLAVNEGDRALAALGSRAHADVPRLVSIELNTADALEDLGKLAEAGRQLETTAVALHDPAVAGSELEVQFWREKGMLAGAELDVPGYLQAMQTASKLAQRVPDLSRPLGDHVGFGLADAYRLAGKLQQAEAAFRGTVRRETNEYGADDARTVFTTAALASVLAFEKRLDEALGLLRRAVPLIEHAFGPDGRRTLHAKAIMAAVYYDQKNFDAAASLWTTVAAGYARKQGEASLDYLDTQADIGIALLREGQLEPAAGHLRRTLEQARAALAPANPEIEGLRYYLAYCLLALRRSDEVPALLDGLKPTTLDMVDFTPEWRVRLAYAAGWLALERGDLPRARQRLADAARMLRPGTDDGFVTPSMVQTLIRQAAEEASQGLRP